MSNQCVFIYMLKIPVLTCFRGGPARPKDQSPSKSGTALGAMLAPFFALGPFLAAFCRSCCVCCHSWSVFVRLGTLRVRFREGLGRLGHGFGGPERSFFEVFSHMQACNAKNSQYAKTTVFPRFLQVFLTSQTFRLDRTTTQSRSRSLPTIASHKDRATN